MRFLNWDQGYVIITRLCQKQKSVEHTEGGGLSKQKTSSMYKMPFVVQMQMQIQAVYELLVGWSTRWLIKSISAICANFWKQSFVLIIFISQINTSLEILFNIVGRIIQRLFNRSIFCQKAGFAFVKSQLKMQFFFCTLLSSFLKSHLYSIEHHLTPLLERRTERGFWPQSPFSRLG